MSAKPNYGFDAPSVIRWLLVFGIASLGFSYFTYYYSRIDFPFLSKVLLVYFFITALCFFTAGFWMIYSSLVAKPRIIAKATFDLHLRGDEQVLDMGCGRGIFLIEIAKHLKSGRAHGIDLWSSKDQSGNSPETTRMNAELEGVADRVEITTADMRQIPYPDATFDLVVSNLAIHNIPTKEERDTAIQELLRVLKPGGHFTILDIQNAAEYIVSLKHHGAKNLEISPPIYRYCPPLTMIKGTR